MIGRRLGRYLIAEKIGEGGMGSAYRATDERLHRDVIELRLFASAADRDFEGTLELLAQMPARDVREATWLWSAELIERHAQHWLGRSAEARRACEATLAAAGAGLEERPEDPRLWVAVANSEALLGRSALAVEAAERALEVAAPTLYDRIQLNQDLATVLAMVGEADRAVEALRRVLDEPRWMTRRWLAVDWRFDAIRHDPGFQTILAED